VDETVLILRERVAIDQILKAGTILNFAYTEENRWIFRIFGTNFGNYFPQIVNFSLILALIPAVYPCRSEIGVQGMFSLLGVKEVFEIVESNCMLGIHIGVADSKITKESRNVKKDRKFVP
jgi:hypothetical protein